MWRRESPSNTKGLQPAVRTIEVERALNARRFCDRRRIRIVTMKRVPTTADLPCHKPVSAHRCVRIAIFGFVVASRWTRSH